MRATEPQILPPPSPSHILPHPATPCTQRPPGTTTQHPPHRRPPSPFSTSSVPLFIASSECRYLRLAVWTLQGRRAGRQRRERNSTSNGSGGSGRIRTRFQGGGVVRAHPRPQSQPPPPAPAHDDDARAGKVAGDGLPHVGVGGVVLVQHQHLAAVRRVLRQPGGGAQAAAVGSKGLRRRGTPVALTSWGGACARPARARQRPGCCSRHTAALLHSCTAAQHSPPRGA